MTEMTDSEIINVFKSYLDEKGMFKEEFTPEDTRLCVKVTMNDAFKDFCDMLEANGFTNGVIETKSIWDACMKYNHYYPYLSLSASTGSVVQYKFPLGMTVVVTSSVNNTISDEVFNLF